YTVIGAAAPPGARYRAVEPNPPTCAVLRRDLAGNGLGRVEGGEAAAGGARAPASPVAAGPGRDLYTAGAGAPLRGGAHLGLAARARRGVAVATVEAAGLVDGVDLLKLDIEGLEAEVLAAVRPWLASVAPTVVVEVRPGARDIERLVAGLVAEIGYRCWAVRA